MSPSNKAVPGRVGAGKTEESLVVSMDETEFVAGGLPTDFDGEVIQARTQVWNYDNGGGPKLDEQGNVILTLAVQLVIRRGDGESDVVNWLSAGDPAHFLPSADGRTPLPQLEDGSTEPGGIYFIRAGSKNALSDSSNYAQFLQELKNAEAATPALARKRTPSVQFLEGLHGHWDRIPQRKRSGIVQADDQGRQREILVVTAVKAPKSGVAGPARAVPAARPAGAAPVARPAAATPVAAQAVASNYGLLDKLKVIVMTAANGAGDDGMLKGKLSKVILQNIDLTQQEKAKGLPIATSVAFLNQGMEEGLWGFDADSGLLIGAGGDL